MKKYIFMAVASMLALSSCSNDDNEPIAQNAPRQMTFTAGFGDGAQTRTSLSGKSVSFVAGDAISIFSANNSNKEFTTTAGGASATFNGTATAGDPTYYAVYPYKDSYTFESSTGVVSGVVIPNDQSAAASNASGWDPNAVIAYATTTGSSLQFKNACALLKVTNDVNDVVRIFVTAYSANSPYTPSNPYHGAMSGVYDLNTSNGTLSKESIADTETAVEVKGGVPNGKTIYIAIVPGNKEVFTAWYESSSQVISKSKNGFNFEAGKIYDLGSTSSWSIP